MVLTFNFLEYGAASQTVNSGTDGLALFAVMHNPLAYM
jgi:hypothetical protein